ncbi:MAG: carbohydrate porin [Gammaproteobacteria bacterium]
MYHRTRARLGGGVLFAVTALAGTSAGAHGRPQVTGIVIATYQTAHEHAVSVRDEAGAAVDVALELPAAGGAFEAEVKGGTTPARNGVTSALPEASAAAGESLDKHGRGRVVLWQGFYRHDLGSGSLAAGLLDPTAWLDGNDIANNEFTQFLGSGLVNNLSIDFPSPSLGIAYTSALGGRWSLAAVLTSATGVEPDYRRAFEPDRHGHGAFAALELQWARANTVANLGVWANTRNLDGNGDGIDDARLGRGAARGIYANVSGAMGRVRWNMRLGWADPRVQSTAGFASVAVAYPMGRTVLGAGAAHALASHHLAQPHRDRRQFEVYVRKPLGKDWAVTPDLQYIVHSDFSAAQPGTWVAGVRVGRSF